MGKSQVPVNICSDLKQLALVFFSQSTGQALHQPNSMPQFPQLLIISAYCLMPLLLEKL